MNLFETFTLDSRNGQTNDQRLHGATWRDLLVALLEHGVAAVAILAIPSLRVQFANRRFADLFVEAGAHFDVSGRKWEDLVATEDQPELADLLLHVARSGEPASRSKLRVEGLSRGTAYWDISLVPMGSMEHESRSVLIQIVDVTQQTLAEQEHHRLRILAEQRAQQFAAALERITDGVVVVDVDGRVRRINTAGIALLDLQAPAEGDGDAEGGDSETSERVQVELPPLHLSLRGQTVRNFEHQITRRDGETTWLNVSSAPLFDRGGSIHGAVAGFQDVSERRRLEQAKDEFLAVTAHELRTPVTALLGYTNLLVKRAELGDWGDRDLHALRMIETQAQRLTQLVNGLIDVSRVQTGSIELQRVRVELRALIEQSAAAARAQAVDHTIVVDASEHPVHVFGDPQRLDQIVTQLIGNALKYSPWGGTVRVGVWANDVAHITVTDDGIGIPDQAIPQLFDRFYRATNVDSDRISGLGIGLYLAKELVAAHGGAISVRSKQGEGTTFEIQLPLRSEDA